MSGMKALGAALITLATVGLTPPAVAAEQPSQPAGQAQHIDLVLSQIDQKFEKWVSDMPVPGLVWGVVKDGQLIHTKGFGVQDLKDRRPVTADSLFRIASMSKAFTALAILKLRDEGKLSLDDLAEKYVPEMRGWRYPTADSPRIRVRDLLNHTAGFVTDDPWGDRQQILPEAEFTKMIRAGVPFSSTPQTKYEYSNLGYALLGRIITNVSGQPYAEYIRNVILRSLEMNFSGYEINATPLERRVLGYRWGNDGWIEEPLMHHGVFGAIGGLHTSANDYARWVEFLLSAWPARDDVETSSIKRSTVREMVQGQNSVFTFVRPNEDGASCRVAAAYGMGLYTADDCNLGLVLYSSGGYPGYASYMLLLPEYGVGFFAFSNRTYRAPALVLWEAAQLLQQSGAITRRTIPVSTELKEAYRAAGAMYEAGDVGPGANMLAMNFLMDRSVENWAREFTRIKQEVGTCDTSAPIKPTGALSGEIGWTCEKGKIQGTLLLAPTNPPTIQALRLFPSK